MGNGHWKVYLPICGISTQGAPFSFYNISLEYTTKDKIPLGKPRAYTSSVKDSIENLCIAVQTDYRDRDKAIDFALEYLEDALSLFRSYSGMFHGTVQALNIISLRRLWSYHDVIASTNGSNFSEQLMPRRRIYDLKIKHDVVERWKNNGFEDILQLLHKSYRGREVCAFDNLLLSSLLWCGGMLEDQNPRDVFLRGVSSIESIVQYKRGNLGISRKFREYGAAILTSGGSSATFSTLRDELLRLYRSRCKISHGATVCSEEHLQWMNTVEDMVCNICKETLRLYLSGITIDEYFEHLDGHME